MFSMLSCSFWIAKNLILLKKNMSSYFALVMSAFLSTNKLFKCGILINKHSSPSAILPSMRDYIALELPSLHCLYSKECFLSNSKMVVQQKV
ncbi:hypothetical protein AC249_AIPGENE27491 [Exaiptasia diaphana]|nr:hypothetical protein AC249_AIPGENE27491 [Exaiptasia diaphana]